MRTRSDLYLFSESLWAVRTGNDQIAMGYSGNLEFERDFLGEGLDMINNF